MIFILGGRGFVGSAFARACEHAGREYAVIDRQSYGDFVDRRCEVLINAAGNSKKFLAARDPMGDFDASVRRVRASVMDFRFDVFVHMSSCDVYPDCSSPSLTSEDQPLDVAAQSPYGFYKYLGELCVRHGARRWLIIRFGGFVGPGLKKNAIFDILNGGPLWLDPGSELQYMRTDEGAKIVLELLDREIRNDVFNVCGRGVVRLEEVIRWAGRKVKVRPGSPKVRYEVNTRKIANVVQIPETRTTVFEFVRCQGGMGQEAPFGRAPGLRQQS